MSTVPPIDQQAVKLGFRSLLAFGEETSWGTRAVPNRSFEFRNEALTLQQPRIESEAIRGTEFQPRWGVGQIAVGGDTIHELATNGFGLFWKHALGSVSSVQPDLINFPTVWEHTFTPGDLTALGLTAQVIRDDLPFDYTGLKVAQLQISCDIDQIAMVQSSWVGRAELKDQTAHTPNFPTFDLLTFIHGSLLIDDVEVAVNSGQLTLENSLNADRRRWGTPYRRNPQRNAFRNLTATLNADFVDLTLYNLFTSGTEAKLDMAFVGDEIVAASGLNFETRVTANVRFDGDTPTVGGPDEIRQPLTVKAFPSTAIPETVRILYRTDDVTP